ncbi:MAG: hypothetical protein J5J06_16030 [Phycisphaerae bacterium]|nr:hypothetical protein [Phycisphaerae bacterium]
MTHKNPQYKVVAFTMLTVMSLTLCGGCTPLSGGEIETFLRDLLLNAAAAFLL